MNCLEYSLQPFAERRGCSLICVARERPEEVHSGCRTHNSLVVLSPGLEAFGCRVRCGLELRNIESRERLFAAEKHTKVRTIELIRGARQEIAAPSSDVNEVVRRKVHSVHEG